MRKRILEYRKMIDRIIEQLENNGKKVDAEKLIREHLTQIAFFQHERLIHLIVTVLFAIMEFLSLFMCMLFPGIGTLLLTFAVMILLIPYIRHYYLLENEVQKMYIQYDKIVAISGLSGRGVPGDMEHFHDPDKIGISSRQDGQEKSDT